MTPLAAAAPRPIARIALVPTAAPAPAVAPPKIDTFERTNGRSDCPPAAVVLSAVDPSLAAQVAAGRMRGGASPSAAAAVKTYEATGDQQFDLRDPQQRQALIAASPQIDNLASTPFDESRCGGAAILNAMIASGDPKANAAAIEKVAGEVGVDVTGDFKVALDAMKQGSMTPKQAAEMQERLVEMGVNVDPRGSNGAQLSVIGVAELSGQLRAAGAFGDADEVRFNLQGNGTTNHWTSTVSTDGHVTSTNSAPTATGQAGVLSYDPSPQLGDARFQADVSLKSAAGGQTTYEVRVPKNAATVDTWNATTGAPLDVDTMKPQQKAIPPPPPFDPMGMNVAP